MFFPQCRVHIYYLVSLPLLEGFRYFFVSEREWLFASGNKTVSSRFRLSENDFRRVLVDESLL